MLLKTVSLAFLVFEHYNSHHLVWAPPLCSIPKYNADGTAKYKHAGVRIIIKNYNSHFRADLSSYIGNGTNDNAELHAIREELL